MIRTFARYWLMLLLIFAGGEVASAEDRAAWLQRARWGVMTHYLADWKARDYHLDMNVEKWNQLIDGFDVEGLAKQLHSVGASYYLITIGQTSGFYLAPNTTYDRIVGIRPSRCSRRDLVSDLYSALSKWNIRLMVYLPSGPRSPEGRKAMHDLHWDAGRNPEGQIEWEQVIRDWSKRWGKEVAGWWFDGCRRPNIMYRAPEAPNFTSFAAAARAGNAESIVAFNPGVYPRILSLTPEQDYTAGEIDDPDGIMIKYPADGKVDGAQIHVLSYLGKTWGTGDPRFTAEQVVSWSQKITSNGGAITWDTPAQLNGLISKVFLDQLAAVGKALPRR